MKNYLSLKEQELLEGAKVTYQNAVKHLKAYSVLKKEDKDFNGFSNTHLIASIEELTKCVLMFLRAKDRKYMNNKDFNQLFRSHSLKHESYYKLISNTFSEIVFELDDKSQVVYGIGALSYFLLKIMGLETKAIDEAFGSKKLEKIRLQGFYVDYSQDTSNWISPCEQKSFQVAFPLIKATFKFVDSNFIKSYDDKIANRLRRKLNL